MYKKLTLILVFALTGLITVATPLSAQEVYLVGADYDGRSNYILANMDGTFSSQQYIGQVPQPYYSYGNGIGDFDNDGDFDYIIGTGYSGSYAHHVYLYEKLGSGNTFAAPVSVDTWTEGYYPMDMAVADYNNDGNMDFVLTHYTSSNSELYLGNGNLTFTRSILYSTAPEYSIGADAADFNNDGNSDFVVSQYSGSNPDPGEDVASDTTSHNPYYIYINLGNGDGTFTTTSFVASGRSWGVTAGDFDNDGNEDIITDGYSGYSFYFYKGNGDGTFQAGTVISGVGSPWVPSPVDNFDFNNDGNMDIVIGYGYYVRYYSGNGDGTFTYVTEITDGTGSDRYCLSAPPGELPEPGSPVADADPDMQTISVGETAYFDGSNSFDTDGGTIVSYEWNFGDGNTGTGVTASHTYTTEGRYRVRLTVTDNDGKIGTDYVAVQVCSAYPQPPRVNVMPGNMPGKVYPYTWLGRVLIIWGNVHDGTPPYTYIWEFGDGSAPVSGTVTNPKYISVTHTYTTMGPKLAVLTVTDACSVSDQDTVEIEVVTMDFQVEVNAAIEDGLRWLYLQQQSNGGWSAYSGYAAAPTAMAILTFEDNGHLPINDINKDIYAEYVQAGLDYLFTTFYSISVPVQEAGDPEEDAAGNTDHNSIGIGVNSGRNGYETGMAMMAIVGSGPLGSPAPDLVATTGPADVIGRTYRDIVIDMVDWCVWAQVEPSRGIHRGGWRYTPNYSDSDNSVSQWPAIGLEAAETNWGIAAPSFVKSELLLWLSASQISGGFYDGAFWYMPNWWAYSPIGVTGAGLCELSYADVPNTDPRVTRMISYLARDWGHSANINNRYNLYAVAKGCRIAVDSLGNLSEIVSIDGIDWFADYATNLMAIQQSDGGWPDQWGRVLSSAWAILVLTPTVVGLPPVAVINAPESVPPNTPFNMDGSDSYHMDPNKMIVEWLWDFDNSDGVDWNNPDAIGSEVVNPGYSLPIGVLADTFVVTLRVADNSDPVMTDIAEHTIIVNFENHPPIADPGGPYAAKVGEIITFDGTGSYDPDSGDYIVSYSWDIDGDGIFGDFTDSVCQYSWNYVYSGYVGLVVTDAYGAISDTSQAYVTVWTAEVDVGIDSSDIFFSAPYPMPEDTIIIYAVVYCDSASDPVSSVRVRFYDGDPDVEVHQINGDQMIYDMMAGDVDTVQVEWCVPDTLPHEIYVRVDPDGELEEYNESNNETFKAIQAVMVGAICDDVTLSNGNPVANVTVKVIDSENNQVGDPIVTSSDGSFYFDSLLVGTYSVMIVTPLGYSVSPGETQTGIEVAGYPCTEVYFVLTPTITSNDCRTIGYWKHQFDVYLTGRGHAQESSEDLDEYLNLAHVHFDVLGIYIDLQNFDFEDAKDVLTVSGGRLMLDRAKQQLFGLLLNFASGRIGNETVVSDDGRVAAEAVTYTVILINDGDPANDELAKTICDLINNGQMVEAGIIPESPERYRFTEHVGIPMAYTLNQNYPNPFNPTTSISFNLPNASNWTLKIYNIIGQLVKGFEGYSSGQVSVTWNGKDNSGNEVASGIYFYKLTADKFSATKKMILVK